MRLLALDFDGVISDSAPESFVVTLRTYAELRPATALGELARCLGGARAPALADVLGAAPYRDFLALMPLGNRAEDYGVMLGAVESRARVPDQEAYDALRAAADPEWLRAFHARFYELRHALAASDPEGWRALMAPYDALLPVLRRRAGDCRLAIATAKDRISVRALLRAYGLEDLFPDRWLLDKEAGVSKSAHLEELRRRSGLPWAQITFVDDKVNHLDSVAPLGVRCALATWGYNGEREWRLARARGYLLCGLDDAERCLFGPLGRAPEAPYPG